MTAEVLPLRAPPDEATDDPIEVLAAQYLEQFKRLVVLPVLDPEKRLSTLKAQCALAGAALVESTDDRHDRPVYIVSRWAMCKQLDSLEAVENWLQMVTGREGAEAT